MTFHVRNSLANAASHVATNVKLAAGKVEHEAKKVAPFVLRHQDDIKRAVIKAERGLEKAAQIAVFVGPAALSVASLFKATRS